MIIKCQICEKVKLHYSRGLCSSCYHSVHANGHHYKYALTDVQKEESKACSENWKKGIARDVPVCIRCGKSHIKARGLCWSCYREAEQGGKLDSYETAYTTTEEDTAVFMFLKNMEKRLTWELPKFSWEVRR